MFLWSEDDVFCWIWPRTLIPILSHWGILTWWENNSSVLIVVCVSGISIVKIDPTYSAPCSSISFVSCLLILIYLLVWSGYILILDGMLKAHINFGCAPTMMRHEIRSRLSTFDFFDVPILREGVSEIQLFFWHVISETCFISLILWLIVDLSGDKRLIISYRCYLAVVWSVITCKNIRLVNRLSSTATRFNEDTRRQYIAW